jgi:DNA mismatch endonuclease (patch repair protein)
MVTRPRRPTHHSPSCAYPFQVTRTYESWATTPASRAVMQANRRKDTAPEMAIRRAIHAAGLRYRVDARPLPRLNRRADLVFSRARVAVFVDGCYWHGCAKHGTVARANAEYWSAKIARNRERDRDTDLRLAEAGWQVLRIWEHEDPIVAAGMVVETIGRRVLECTNRSERLHSR